MSTNRVASATVSRSGAEDRRAEVERAVRAFQEGRDRERSFGVLFRQYHRRVEGFFFRKGFSTEECLDLTQETFLGVYRGLEGFRLEARFDTWLFSVARNVLLKRLRSQGAAKRSGEEVTVEEGRLEAFPGAATPQLAGLLARETRGLLEAAMADLSTKMRQCMELRVYHGMRYREIAVVLKISVNTVKTHIFEARRKLKARLGEVFEQGWEV